MRAKSFFSWIGWLPIFWLVCTAHAAPWDKSVRIERAFKKYSEYRTETAAGTVERVYEKVPSFGKKNHDALGFHLILRTATGPIDVHLGPTWYLGNLDGKVGPGDMVEIFGSMDEEDVSGKGGDTTREMRASEVRKGGDVVLRLRDDEGRPLWSDH